MLAPIKDGALIRQTIDGHLVKIGFPEKSGWKAYLGGPVKYY
jgi:hypothetical protein